jgi:hypothetical protein
MKWAWSTHRRDEKFYMRVGNLMKTDNFGGLRVKCSFTLEQPNAELVWTRQWNCWFLKGTKLSDLLNDSQLLRKCSAPWSYIDIQTSPGAHIGPLSNGYRTLSPPPGVHRLRRETDHLPESGTDAKNAWSYISIPTYISMAWCLIKPR